MLKSTSCTVTYTAWSSATGGLLTGDVTNHTVTWSKDGGTPATCTNSPTEVGGGVYKISLTSTETNCNLGTLCVSSSTTDAVVPPVQFVFHDASAYKADVSSIPASVWSNSTRTLTSSPSVPSASDNASAVWAASSRTLTASPTDISSLATSSEVSAVQTAVNGLSIPTVSQIQNGLATSSAVSAVQTAVNGLSIPTVSQIQNGLATSSEVSAVQTAVNGLSIPTVSQIQNGLATASDLSDVADLLAKVFALVGKWSVSGNTLTAYDDSGNAIYTGTLTRDEDDNITAVTETTASSSSSDS